MFYYPVELDRHEILGLNSVGFVRCPNSPYTILRISEELDLSPYRVSFELHEFKAKIGFCIWK